LTIWTAIFFRCLDLVSAAAAPGLLRPGCRRRSEVDPQDRFTSGLGIPLTGLTLTFAAIYWIKSLEYHWFSTM